MQNVPNLFAVIMAGGRGIKISKRGKEMILGLNKIAQIDHDRLGRPIVLKVTQNHGLDEIYILRNNRVESITVNPRGNSAPQITWDTRDGYKRPERSPLKMDRNTQGARRERARRDQTVKYDLENVLSDHM